MDLKIIEEIGAAVLHMIKTMGLNINNPHHINAVSAIISEIFAYHEKQKAAKEAGKPKAPKPIKIDAAVVTVNAKGDVT